MAPMPSLVTENEKYEIVMRYGAAYVGAVGMKKVAALAMILVGGMAGCKFFAGQEKPREPGRAHRVTLTWDKVARASGYNVYRRPYRGGEFVALGKAATPTLEDPAAMGGERYCYRVASLDAKGKEGAPSKEFCVTIPYP